MSRPFALSLALATFVAVTAHAQSSYLQNTYVAAPGAASYPADPYGQQTPAAIERAPARVRPVYRPVPHITSSQLVAGVWLRSESGATVETMSADKRGTEVRVTSGRVNLAVHHPAQDSQILVDLPGGQTALLKDGVYTFNAESDTVHVLEGEAVAYPGNREGDGIKLKDNRMFTFGEGAEHATMFEPTAANTDLLAGSYSFSEDRGHGDSYGGEYLYAGSPYYGFAPYGDWGYPYGGWGYPYGYGFGYGYPFGVGFGVGYYGGFRGGYGGLRGGYGGFRGGYGGLRGGFGGGFRR